MIRWEDAPGPYEVVFSTREGGVSEGPYASLNLGRATADEPERVDENRRRLCAEVGAEPDALAMNYQHHSADVLRAQAGDRGARAGTASGRTSAACPMLALAADCLPIALARANGSEPALALLHAGWRGLLEGIVPAGRVGSRRPTVSAAVGPAIGPCCYEVGEEVADRFRRAFGFGLVPRRQARPVDRRRAGSARGRLRTGRPRRPLHGLFAGALLLAPPRRGPHRKAGRDWPYRLSRSARTTSAYAQTSGRR